MSKTYMTSASLDRVIYGLLQASDICDADAESATDDADRADLQEDAHELRRISRQLRNRQPRGTTRRILIDFAPAYEHGLTNGEVI